MNRQGALPVQVVRCEVKRIVLVALKTIERVETGQVIESAASAMSLGNAAAHHLVNRWLSDAIQARVMLSRDRLPAVSCRLFVQVCPCFSPSIRPLKLG